MSGEKDLNESLLDDFDEELDELIERSRKIVVDALLFFLIDCLIRLEEDFFICLIKIDG
jgi:hypothetical protein